MILGVVILVLTIKCSMIGTQATISVFFMVKRGERNLASSLDLFSFIVKKNV